MTQVCHLNYLEAEIEIPQVQGLPRLQSDFKTTPKQLSETLFQKAKE